MATNSPIRKEWKMDIERLSFTAACLKYFGRKQGQSNTEFINELRALDEKDREYFKALFRTVGIVIV